MALGGYFRRRRVFCAPYTEGAPGRDNTSDDDAWILKKSVRMRAQPRSNAPVVAVLTYELVMLEAAEPTGEKTPHGFRWWSPIQTRQGKQGWVPCEEVRSIVDTHACFEKRRGRWWLVDMFRGD